MDSCATFQGLPYIEISALFVDIIKFANKQIANILKIALSINLFNLFLFDVQALENSVKNITLIGLIINGLIFVDNVCTYLKTAKKLFGKNERIE